MSPVRVTQISREEADQQRKALMERLREFSDDELQLMALANVALGWPTVYSIHLHHGGDAALDVALEDNTPKTFVCLVSVTPKPEPEG